MSSDDEVGIKSVLAGFLIHEIQIGNELSEDDWQWLYERIGKNKPPTLELFKGQLILMLGEWKT